VAWPPTTFYTGLVPTLGLLGDANLVQGTGWMPAGKCAAS
jgi:hypothetical protein